MNEARGQPGYKETRERKMGWQRQGEGGWGPATRRQGVSLVPRPHPPEGRDGLVNEVEFLGLEAYYGMCNHCIIPWC